jgi:hypothetical protein
MDPYKIIGTSVVAISGSSAASPAFTNQTTIVRVVSTTDCFIRFDATPTATTTQMLLPANVVEYFRVTPGHKIAGIQRAAGGNLYVTEMTR